LFKNKVREVWQRSGVCVKNEGKSMKKPPQNRWKVNGTPMHNPRLKKLCKKHRNHERTSPKSRQNPLQIYMKWNSQIDAKKMRF